MTEIIPVPAFEDNYIWLICSGRDAVAVDPGDAAPVLEYLARHSLRLAAILNTHHHRDHVAGNAGLLKRFGNMPVFGPRGESIAGVNRPVAEGDTVAIAAPSLRFGVLDTPGHTAGHIAYYGADMLFCGDTLFGCGCGRLFEGTPAQMTASLQKLAALPDDTRVYCAHEYTLANIRFALAVGPDNAALRQRETSARQARANGLPTLPSTLALEKRTNPFLRLDEPAVAEAASRFAGRRLDDPASVFAALREWKNRF